jgi:hypothetical protein
MDTLLMTKTEETLPKKMIIHWVWADDENETYCGRDATFEPWMGPNDPPVNCTECIRIQEICDLEEMMEND